MLNFKKIFKIILIIILLLLIINLGKKLYFIGNITEREQILEATVWQLSKEGYTKDDIKTIYTMYDPLKGGVYPYKYSVYVVLNDESTAKIYMWNDKTKTSTRVFQESPL